MGQTVVTLVTFLHSNSLLFCCRLVPKPNCVKVPKEICVNTKTNPRRVQRPVVKEWCYRPKDLEENPGTFPAGLLNNNNISNGNTGGGTGAGTGSGSGDDEDNGGLGATAPVAPRQSRQRQKKLFKLFY